VSVKDGEGVEVSLQDMTNTIAPVAFCVNGPKQCCGSLWASAKGESYMGLNTIVVDETGHGHMVTTTTPGGFNVGDIEVHHQMDNFVCEALADAGGLLDGIVIDLVSKKLQSAFPEIIAKVFDTPVNLVLGALENPPALGFGREKFRLDNSFISVDYSDHWLTHFHKGEFKSTANPKESQQIPPPLDVPKNKDVAIGFSDYTLNTLFEAFKEEHMFEKDIELPLHTPSALKLCSHCPLVVSITFEERGEAVFLDGHATNKLHGMKFELGAKTGASLSAPLATCEGQCASVDQCTGTSSSAQHPSCAMGCLVAKESASAEECKATCTAHDNTCDFWTAGGKEMDNCGDCPGTYPNSQACLAGCDYHFASSPQPSPATQVAPLFTVTVDAAASMAFELSQPTGKAPQLKATLSLDSFQQKEVISFIGKINTDDLNRDIKAVVGALLEKINKGLPALPILSIPGVKYENPSFDVHDHLLVMAADLVRASVATHILV